MEDKKEEIIAKSLRLEKSLWEKLEREAKEKHISVNTLIWQKLSVRRGRPKK